MLLGSRDGMKSAGRASAIGIELAASVIGFLLLGWWLDGRFHTAPYLTIVGLLIGSFAGFRALFSLSKSIERDEGEDQKSKPNSGSGA
jgi:ATP synthase protein I